MNIGLIAVDGKHPNMAIMQIASYHEQKGDHVEWWQGPLWNDTYDKVYASKIFDFSKLPKGLPDNVIIGGTGIDFQNRLPDEIASVSPSWSLYPTCDYHLGFSMKGCRFACKFCCVPQKEGRPWHNASIDEILINPNGGNRIMLLDNDFFGSPNWKEDLHRIIELNLKVCFVQGLNIRIITQEQAELLAQCRYYNKSFQKRYVTFAWDKFKDEKIVMKGINICNDAGIPCKRMQFYVLIGFDTTEEEDLHRIMMLHNMGCMPFVMPYDKSNEYQKRMAKYVNSRKLIRTVPWHEYVHNYKESDDPEPELFN